MKKKIKISVSLLVLAILSTAAAYTAVVYIQTPREITIIFPEMSQSQKKFIAPLLASFELQSRFTVKSEYRKSTDIYKELQSEGSKADLYYLINNFQLNQIKKDSSLSTIKIKRSEGIPDLFLKDEYFIPISWYPWGIYYNKSIFSELKLSEPESWDEFLKLSETIKAEAYTPLSLMTKVKWPSTPWFDSIDILINGEDFHRDLLAGEIPFTDKRVKATFSEIQNLHKKGFIHMESESFEWQSMITMLEEEKTLMCMSGSFFYENAAESFKANLGWFPFPEVKSLVASSSGFVSPSGEKNQRAVRKFLEYVLSEEGQGIMQRNSDLIAVNSFVSERLGRDDLDSAISILNRYESITPVFERNTHEKLLMPFKSAINLLYTVTDENQLTQILENLEEYRLSSIK